MKILKNLSLLFGLSLAVIMPSAANAQMDRSEVETIVREYLLQNPEIIREAFEELERRQNADRERLQRDALIASADDIFRAPDALIGGNPEGDVTLVEFFDYNCGFCKRALSDMKSLLDTDPNVRVVYKEWPFLGPESIEASRVSLAVSKQGRYAQYHDALLGIRGQANAQRAFEVAEALGYDIDRVRRDMEDPAIIERLEKTMELAQAIGVTGTPTYVIGDQVIMGAQGLETLRSAIDQVRVSGCQAC